MSGNDDDKSRIAVLETKVDLLTVAVAENTRVLRLVHDDLIIREAKNKSQRVKWGLAIAAWTAILPTLTLAMDRLLG